MCQNPNRCGLKILMAIETNPKTYNASQCKCHKNCNDSYFYSPNTQNWSVNLLKGKIQHYHQKSSNTEKIIKSATTRKSWIKMSVYSKGMRDKFQINTQENLRFKVK